MSVWNIKKFLTNRVEYILENRHVKNWKPAWCNETGTEGLSTEDLISKDGYYEQDGCNLIFISHKKML